MPPRVQLRLILADGKSIGPGKADLLALIDRLGSIAAAGREMKMSYKRAWGLVEEMNGSFSAPLVTTERGGADRGGARVTDLGLAVLARYRHLVAGVQVAGAQDIDFIARHLRETKEVLPGGAQTVISNET